MTIFYECCNNRKKIRKGDEERERKINKNTDDYKMPDRKERENHDYDNIL
jgi:hypothetical protein